VIVPEWGAQAPGCRGTVARNGPTSPPEPCLDGTTARIHRIGLISDTHGLLRPEVRTAFAGSELILHAGDVGHPDVLDALREVAPVVAVRGNVDRGDWARGLPLSRTLMAGGARILVVHDQGQLPSDLGRARPDAVVSGHSHRPLVVERGGVLFVNPSSAGPRRFGLPVCVALLRVEDGRVRAEIRPLAA
jgi:putative phosphoesterase